MQSSVILYGKSDYDKLDELEILIQKGQKTANIQFFCHQQEFNNLLVKLLLHLQRHIPYRFRLEITDLTIQLIKSLDKVVHENEAKQLLADYGRAICEKLKTDNEIEQKFADHLETIDQLLQYSIHLELHSLCLFNLDSQIERVKKIQKDDNENNQKQYVTNLTKFRNNILAVLEAQKQNKENKLSQKSEHVLRTEIFGSTTCKLVNDINELLSGLSYTPQDKNNDQAKLKAFYSKYKDKDIPNSAINFLNSLAKILCVPIKQEKSRDMKDPLIASFRR